MQVQSKAYLEALHHSALVKLDADLSRENWSAAFASSEAQEAVNDIFRQADMSPGSSASATAASPGIMLLHCKKYTRHQDSVHYSSAEDLAVAKTRHLAACQYSRLTV